MMDKKHCAGCHNNVYNHGLGGAEQCWSLSSAKIEWRKEVHVDQVPPWDQKAKRVPSCYRKPRYVYVDADRTN